MIVVKKAIPRRTVLRGLGAAVALPLLDSMVPSLTAIAKTDRKSTRLNSSHIQKSRMPSSA